MGKRELLIVLGFVVVGVIAYQFTAAPRPEGATGFSWSKMVQEFRREVQGDPGAAVRTHTGTIVAPAGLTEVRITGVTGRVEITGEERTDIAYELRVSSSGPDDARAAALADRTRLRQDDLGPTLALSVAYPREARQRTGLVLRVPARLAARLDGGGGSEGVSLQGMRVAQLEGVAGDVKIRAVAERVTGTHRNGKIEVIDVGSVDLTLSSSRGDFIGVRGAVTLSARNGECKVQGAAGAIVIEQTNNEVHVSRSTGTVKVTGTNGSVAIEGPLGEVDVDVRRAEVDIMLDGAVRLTALTTEEPIRLVLGARAAATLDAVATDGGSIAVDDKEIAAGPESRDVRVSREFGAAGGPRVALRNQRGAIEIRQAK